LWVHKDDEDIVNIDDEDIVNIDDIRKKKDNIINNKIFFFN